jgi:hypothetical protein
MLAINIGIVPTKNTDIAEFENFVVSHLLCARKNFLEHHADVRLLHYRESLRRIAELKGIGSGRKINATTIRPDVLGLNIMAANINDVPTDNPLILLCDTPIVRRYLGMVLFHEIGHAKQKFFTPSLYLNLAAQHFLKVKLEDALLNGFQKTTNDQIIDWLVDFTKSQKKLEQRYGSLPFHTMDPFLEYNADLLPASVNTTQFRMWRRELRKQEPNSFIIFKTKNTPFQHLLGFYCYKRAWSLAFGENSGLIDMVFRTRWSSIRKAGIELSRHILSQQYEKYLACLVQILVGNKSSPFKSKVDATPITEVVVHCTQKGIDAT